MDYYEIFTEFKEFKIVLKKRKRLFNATEYSNYVCTLEFRNNLDQILVSLEGTELTFVKFVEGLNDFIVNFGQIISNNLYFSDSGNGSSYFFYIAMNPEVDYPAEDDDKVYLLLFETSMQGQVLRLNLETSIYWIEEFIFAIFQILEDIPYLGSLVSSTALEYIDYSQVLKSPF